MNNINTIKKRKHIRIYNQMGSAVSIPLHQLYSSHSQSTRGCLIDGSRNGKYEFADITWEDVCYINDTTNIIKYGMISFDKDDERAIYKELGISDWENILFEETIEDIILHPTMEKLQKIIEIKDIITLERVRGKLLYFINTGADISTNTINVINGRWFEFNHSQRVSKIELVSTKATKPADEKEVSELKDEVAALREIVTQLTKTKECVL